MSYSPRLQAKYNDEIVPALMKEFGYKSIMEVPKLVKIALNQGVGSAITDKKLLDATIEELSLITGQSAVKTYSKKDISNFKLRVGMGIGAKVTLRRARMLEFLDRLVAVSLPRVRDFKGISDKGFDGRGNYTLGIKEQLIFPEIVMDKINRIQGMNITFVTTAKTDAECLALLKAYGLPFKNQK